MEARRGPATVRLSLPRGALLGPLRPEKRKSGRVGGYESTHGERAASSNWRRTLRPSGTGPQIPNGSDENFLTKCNERFPKLCGAHHATHPAHICAGTGLTPPTSAPGLGPPLPTSAPGLAGLHAFCAAGQRLCRARSGRPLHCAALHRSACVRASCVSGGHEAANQPVRVGSQAGMRRSTRRRRRKARRSPSRTLPGR